jgi:hypothetical protein
MMAGRGANLQAKTVRTLGGNYHKRSRYEGLIMGDKRR